MQCPFCQTHTERTKAVVKEKFTVYACPKCQLQWLSPQPTDQELNDLYSEEYYKAWGIQGKGENDVVRRMKEATFDLRFDLIQQYKKTGAVLDVGCATGFFLDVADRRGFVPYGVELSPYAADIAKKKFGADRVCEGTLETCAFPERFFDVIAMSDLIEHVRDPRTFLQRAFRVLKDDGIVLIMTPDTHSLTNAVMGGHWTHYKLEHLFYFNKTSLEAVARDAGFALVQYERAKKIMTLPYLYTQLSVHRHWFLTPLVRLLCRVFPGVWSRKNFPITMGEMVVILKKQ